MRDTINPYRSRAVTKTTLLSVKYVFLFLFKEALYFNNSLELKMCDGLTRLLKMPVGNEC